MAHGRHFLAYKFSVDFQSHTANLRTDEHKKNTKECGGRGIIKGTIAQGERFRDTIKLSATSILL
jgi:hypothetical protein